MANDNGDDLNLEIRRVGAEAQADGTLAVEIDTSRGAIPGVFHAHEGPDGAVVWVGGARGGLDGPAGGLYADLARDLVARGVSSLRLDYRRPASSPSASSTPSPASPCSRGSGRGGSPSWGTRSAAPS